jgi:hypothetical protein
MISWPGVKQVGVTGQWLVGVAGDDTALEGDGEGVECGFVRRKVLV